MLGTGMLMAMEIPENQLRKATKRHASPRPVVRLFIPRGSPLAISLAALLTSVGRACGVQQASREMSGLIRSDQLSSDEDESSTGDEL